MKNQNYYVVHGWMVNELDLSGNDLLIYAIIYGFSQDGESAFKGSLSYLENTAGASRRTVQRSLEFLVNKGYIKRIPMRLCGVRFNKYVANDTPMVKMTRGYGQNDQGGMVKMTPNNTSIYNTNNNTLYIRDFFTKISQETLNIIQKNAALPASEFERAVERFLLDREEKGTTYQNENQVLAGLRKWMMSYSTNYHDQKSKGNGRIKRGSTGRPVAAEKTSHAGGFGQL